MTSANCITRERKGIIGLNTDNPTIGLIPISSDVLWLTVVVALAVAWWIEHRHHVSSAATVKTLEATVADQEATILMLNTSWMAARGG